VVIGITRRSAVIQVKLITGMTFLYYFGYSVKLWSRNLGNDAINLQSDQVSFVYEAANVFCFKEIRNQNDRPPVAIPVT
jgi:hypothetical protein